MYLDSHQLLFILFANPFVIPVPLFDSVYTVLCNTVLELRGFYCVLELRHQLGAALRLLSKPGVH